MTNNSESVNRLQMAHPQVCLRIVGRLTLAILLISCFITAGASTVQVASKDHKAFAALSAKLSEMPGYFDSDNLISNETSYQHVFGRLRDLGVKGGVYVGVGPDQNFTYLAEIRPKMAIMIDIRRDNLLQHLWLKAIFAKSRNRIEHLCYLFGRPLPKSGNWEQKTLKELADYIDTTPPDQKLHEKNAAELQKDVQKFGIALSNTDLQTINNIHAEFFQYGLDIRYSSHHRPPRSIYPTYRELLLERDLSGQQNNYFASEDRYQFLKKMQDQDLIVPVVGDLSGPQAMKAVAKYIVDMKEKVTAFYASNVEFYLVRQGSFDKFIENLKAFPIDNNSVIIRSYFNYYAPKHPQAEGDHFSTQLLQRISDLLKQCDKGECENYMDIVTKGSIPLRDAQ